jgi:hypothetical protein
VQVILNRENSSFLWTVWELRSFLTLIWGQYMCLDIFANIFDHAYIHVDEFVFMASVFRNNYIQIHVEGPSLILINLFLLFYRS